ncbi:MAG TPA: hypothetical protein VE967_00810 [Gemmatimonadaceae bacterium]|nr:hypothetical protein [Gemmatimonadaceae bacterium]
MIIVLRLIHILCGVFWVGTLIFNSVFLGPAIREAGPEGGKVMGILVKNGLPKIMPVVAILAILAGLALYDHNSAHFKMSYMQTNVGMAFGIGGVLAIITLILGATILAPTLEHMGKIGQQMASASPADKERLTAELQGLRGKAKTFSNIVAVTGVLASAIMAIARYL